MSAASVIRPRTGLTATSRGNGSSGRTYNATGGLPERTTLPLSTGNAIFGSMPDVGLTTANEPFPPEAKVVIKYSVEVEGLPVYQESYDLGKLAVELATDRERFKDLWLRRVECVVASRHRPEFSATLTRCLARGVEAPE